MPATLTTKGSKKLADLRRRLSCAQVPHIRRLALRQLVDFVVSEQKTSGSLPANLARTLALSVAGLMPPDTRDVDSGSAQTSGSISVPVSHGLAPTALDVLFEIHLIAQGEIPKHGVNGMHTPPAETGALHHTSPPAIGPFLEWLGATLTMLARKDIPVFSSVYTWFAEATLNAVFDGVLPLGRSFRDMWYLEPFFPDLSALQVQAFSFGQVLETVLEASCVLNARDATTGTGNFAPPVLTVISSFLDTLDAYALNGPVEDLTPTSPNATTAEEHAAIDASKRNPTKRVSLSQLALVIAAAIELCLEKSFFYAALHPQTGSNINALIGRVIRSLEVLSNPAVSALYPEANAVSLEYYKGLLRVTKNAIDNHAQCPFFEAHNQNKVLTRPIACRSCLLHLSVVRSIVDTFGTHFQSETRRSLQDYIWFVEEIGEFLLDCCLESLDRSDIDNCAQYLSLWNTWVAETGCGATSIFTCLEAAQACEHAALRVGFLLWRCAEHPGIVNEGLLAVHYFCLHIRRMLTSIESHNAAAAGIGDAASITAFSASIAAALGLFYTPLICLKATLASEPTFTMALNEASTAVAQCALDASEQLHTRAAQQCFSSITVDSVVAARRDILTLRLARLLRCTVEDLLFRKNATGSILSPSLTLILNRFPLWQPQSAKALLLWNRFLLATLLCICNSLPWSCSESQNITPTIPTASLSPSQIVVARKPPAENIGCAQCQQNQTRFPSKLQRCATSIACLYYLSDIIIHHQALEGDAFLPLLVSFVQLNGEQSSRLSCIEPCLAVRAYTLHVIATLGRERLLVPSLYRCIGSSLPEASTFQKDASNAPHSAQQVILSCITISALGELHSGGELLLTKIRHFLNYNPEEPLLLRASKLRVLTEMAEETPSDAVDCLKDIQLGLKDQEPGIRGLSLSCLGHLCSQDMMDFNKVWSILKGRHYVNTVLAPALQTFGSCLHMANFLKQFVITSVIPGISAVCEALETGEAPSLSASSLPSPLALSVSVAELSLELLRALPEKTLKETACPKRGSSAVGQCYLLLLEVLGRVAEALIRATALNTGWTRLCVCCADVPASAVFPSSEEKASSLYKTDWVDTLLFETVLSLANSSTPPKILLPMTPLNLTCMADLYHFCFSLLGAVQSQDSIPIYADHRTYVEEGCSRFLYFLMRPAQESLVCGNRGGSRHEDHVSPSPSFLLLSKALKTLFTPQKAETLPRATLSLLKLATGSLVSDGAHSSKQQVAYGKAPSSNTTVSFSASRDVSERFIVLYEMLMNMPCPWWTHTYGTFWPQFWTTFFERSIGRSADPSLWSTGASDVSEGLLEGLSYDPLVLQLLKLLHLTETQERLLQTAMGFRRNDEPAPIKTSEACITISGSPDAYCNVLFAATALCRRSDVSVGLTSAVFELVRHLLKDALSPSRLGDLQSERSGPDTGMTVTGSGTDLLETPLRLSVACLVNLNLLGQRIPQRVHTLHCLSMCERIAGPQDDAQRGVFENAARSIEESVSLPSTGSPSFPGSTGAPPGLSTHVFPSALAPHAMDGLISYAHHNWEVIPSLFPVLLHTFTTLLRTAQKDFSSDSRGIDLLLTSAAEASVALSRFIELMGTVLETRLCVSFLSEALGKKLLPLLTRDDGGIPEDIPFTSVAALPICCGVFLLARRDQLLDSFPLSTVVQRLEDAIAFETLSRKPHAVLSQALLYLESIRTRTAVWGRLSRIEQQQCSAGLRRMRDRLQAASTLLSKTPTSLRAEEAWDRKVSTLLLSGLNLFPWTAMVQDGLDTAGELPLLSHGDTAFYHTLETCGIVAKTTGAGARGRVRLDLQPVITGFHPGSAQLQQSVLLLGLLYHHLSALQVAKRQKIDLTLIASHHESSNAIYVALKLFGSFAHDIEERDRILQCAATDSRIEGLTDIRSRLTAVAVLCRAVSYLSPLPCINLSITIAKTFQVVHALHSGVSPEGNDNYGISRVTLALLCSLLRLCDQHGAHDPDVTQILFTTLLRFQTRPLHPSQTALRSLAFVGVTLFPLLFLRGSHAQALRLHRALTTQLSDPRLDPSLWCAFLANLTRLSSSLRALTEAVISGRMVLGPCPLEGDEGVPFLPRIGNISLQQTLKDLLSRWCLCTETQRLGLLDTRLRLFHRLVWGGTLRQLIDFTSPFGAAPWTIPRFKPGCPGPVISAFTLLVDQHFATFTSYQKAVPAFGSLEDIADALPTLILGYLVAQKRLPLSFLHRRKDRVLYHSRESSEGPSSKSDHVFAEECEAFATAVRFIPVAAQAPILEAVLRSASAPDVVHLTTLKHVLCYLILHLSGRFSLCRLPKHPIRSTDTTSPLGHAQPLRLQRETSTLQIQTSTMEDVTQLPIGKRMTPLFSGNALFFSEAGLHYLQSLPPHLPASPRPSIRLNISDVYSDPNAVPANAASPQRLFSDALFSWPPCLYPTFSEFAALTLLPNDGSASVELLQSPPGVAIPLSVPQLLLEKGAQIRPDPTASSFPHLSHDAAKVFLAKRASSMTLQARLQRYITLTNLSSPTLPFLTPEDYIPLDINFSTLSTCRKLGMQVVTALFSQPAVRLELSQALWWLLTPREPEHHGPPGEAASWTSSRTTAAPN